MKKSIVKICFAIAAVCFLVSCENETEENPIAESFLQQDASQQLVSVKDVSTDEKTAQLVAFLKNSEQQDLNLSRVGCTLNSDVGCGSDAIIEIEEYVNQSGCITYPIGNLIFPVQAVQYTYNYSYYVDSDSDINMDQFQFQFDSHVANIQTLIAPNKITFISADASNSCAGGRGFKVSNITYTVILGN